MNAYGQTYVFALIIYPQIDNDGKGMMKRGKRGDLAMMKKGKHIGLPLRFNYYSLFLIDISLHVFHQHFSSFAVDLFINPIIFFDLIHSRRAGLIYFIGRFINDYIKIT